MGRVSDGLFMGENKVFHQHSFSQTLHENEIHKILYGFQSSLF